MYEPSIIILDNARNHKCKPSNTPNANKSKKAELLNELTRVGLEYDTSITVTEARVTLRNWQNENFLSEIVQLAAAQGHKVLFTPPHFNDLQPIELVWARIKGAVARIYTKKTTLNDI